MTITSNTVSTASFQHYVGESESIRFMNPLEYDFASLLEKLNLDWSYEPTRFVLETYEDGTEKIGFQPDFYLPKMKLYLELTGSPYDGSSAKEKHRKVRLLNDADFDESVILLCRQDLAELEKENLVSFPQFARWLNNTKQRMLERLEAHERRRKHA